MGIHKDKMDKKALIYVAGHTGLIGSAIVKELSRQGYKRLILRTHKELDLTDQRRTDLFFKQQMPEYVFLAAAKVGGISANSSYPAHFIYQNIMIEANIINSSYKYGVKKLLFLASSCIYPKICPQPTKEQYLLTGPIEPTNEAYAIAKIAGVKMCQAYNKQFGTHFISVIPANVYGLNDNFTDDGHVIASLIKRFHNAKIAGEETIIIWGTGKPRREFIYVDDVARACIFLMRAYTDSKPLNIGGGLDISIAELAEKIKRIVGFRGRIKYDTNKPDGIPRRLLYAAKIKALGWRPKTSLDEGLKLTYNWYKGLKR
jgi:GDP-L-fucose synthase